MNEEFNQLRTWLLDSGLVISNTNDENIGGVYSYFDSSKNEYGFVYPEITGYFLSTLRFLHKIEPDEKLVEKSKLSADWLEKIHTKYGGIIQGITDMGHQNLVYSFDTGVCAKGILDCYVLTGEKKYLNFAQKLLGWVKNEAVEHDGTIRSIYDLSSQQFQRDDSLWYKQKGCLHIKNTIPFCVLYSITNDSKLLDVINKICNSYVKFQNNDGSLSLHQNKKIIHMHTLCYAVEGLLYAFYTTKNDQFLNVCKKSLDWAALQIQKDGSSNLWFNSRYKQAKTCYHTAQLIRAMILVDKIDDSTKYKNHIKSLKSFLIRLQAHSENSKINGGFYEEKFKTLIGWKQNPRLNSWGSMFALQAIYWEVNYDNISFSEEMPFLF